jgi:hypothetical protein
MKAIGFALVPLIVGGGVAAYAILQPCTSSKHGTESVAPPLRVTLLGPPPPIRDLGIISAGSRREVPFLLVNEGTAAVRFGEVKTSCECLSASLDTNDIGAGESVAGRLVFDLAKDPAFRGVLLLTSEAPVAGGSARKAFTIRLNVEVK